MELKKLPYDLTVCKLESAQHVNWESNLVFLGKTDEELSLVCETHDAPERTLEREDGWKGFRVQGVLDFSLVGILSRISGALAAEGIAVFAVSTFNTDYILVKAEDFERASEALSQAGCVVSS